MIYGYAPCARRARGLGLALCLTLVFAPALFAQQTSIFPTLGGEQLREALVSSYKTSTTFGYDRARDSLFAAVYYEDGIVRCVYTDWPIMINRNSAVAPRTQAHDQGVNTEHTWPQSLGAGSGNARSDLHHLFPTRGDANTSRSNHPFAELDPAVVSRWWYLDQSPSSTPDEPLSLWSRTSTTLAAFQPRDEHKGRVARAMFYFYTMYPDEVGADGPEFFGPQMETLYRWHYTYPPDDMEHQRTALIGSYQGGNPNPFVVDSTLIRRAFYSEPAHPGSLFDAIYTFDGTQSCTEQQNAVAAQPVGVSFSEFGRVGVLCNQAADVFNSRAWAEAPVRDDSRYVTFSVVADEGQSIYLGDGSFLRFQSQRSSTGPADAEVRISVNDGPFVSVGGWAPGTTSSTHQFSLPDIDSISSLEMRLYGWSASGSGGTLRFDNVRVVGRVGPVQEVRALLQGALADGTMRTSLRDGGLIPLSQPFSEAPWNYAGSELVQEVPEAVVDWILVDIYDGELENENLSLVARQAGFLRADGLVTGLDGATLIRISDLPNGDYHLAIRHRNHIPVVSATRVTFFSGRGRYDFSTSVSRAHTSMMARLDDGIRSAMWAGDATGDSQVTAADFNAFLSSTTAGATGYLAADYNLDGQVTAADFNLFLQATMAGAAYQLP
ncbi:hypothetical protein BH23BAC4_BH23BAC4_11700 [soil metagenome]